MTRKVEKSESRDYLLEQSLEEAGHRRKLQKFGGKLLALGGAVLLAGFLALFAAEYAFALTADQANIFIGTISVLASLFAGPGIMYMIMGSEPSRRNVP